MLCGPYVLCRNYSAPCKCINRQHVNEQVYLFSSRTGIGPNLSHGLELADPWIIVSSCPKFLFMLHPEISYLTASLGFLNVGINALILHPLPYL